MKNYYYLLFGVFFISSLAVAQSTFEPISIQYGTFLGESIPLKDLPQKSITDDISNLPMVPQNFNGGPQLNPNALPVDGDPLAKNNRAAFRSPGEIIQNFDGIDINQGQAGVPDPTGAVGPNHYMHAVNFAVEIYDKTGTSLVGPVSLATFFGNGNNSGDPIILYDQLADRWMISQFRILPGPVFTNFVEIAVSTTPDPTGTYNLYEFDLASFPDYPHYSIWHNAFLLTSNKSGQTAFAMDRQAMVNGDPNPALVGFSLPGLVRRPQYVFGAGPSNLLGTTFDASTPGYIVYMQDDGWSGAISEDHIKIWSMDLDFVTPANSTISAPQEIVTTPFDTVFFAFGQGDVEQPGTSNRIDNPVLATIIWGGPLAEDRWGLLNTSSIVLNDLLIYPNPTSSVINVQFETTFQTSTLSLFDMTGREVFTTTTERKNTPIDLSYLSRGMYILNVENNGGKLTKKIQIR